LRNTPTRHASCHGRKGWAKIRQSSGSHLSSE
jgi:hypothetical protein